MISPTIDSEGVIGDMVAISDEEPLWVGVVARNESGENPYVDTFGPVYALNNNVLETRLSLDFNKPLLFDTHTL